MLSRDACRSSLLPWLKERAAYYSGVAYGRQRLCDGTAYGTVVALSIGIANVIALILAAFCTVCCCVHARSLRPLMQAVAPSTLRAVELDALAAVRLRP